MRRQVQQLGKWAYEHPVLFSIAIPFALIAISVIVRFAEWDSGWMRSGSTTLARQLRMSVIEGSMFATLMVVTWNAQRIYRGEVKTQRDRLFQEYYSNAGKPPTL
jgi:hypothetical protein